MIIVGIDPGSRVTGYGVIDFEGSRLSCLEYGAVSTLLAGPALLPDRLKLIHHKLQELLERYSPCVVAVEEVFHALNVKSALKLGHARGVILLAAAQSGAPLVEYSPLEIKKAVAGYGRADKQQIQTMVCRLLKLREVPDPHDAADALAVALCHAFNGSRSRHIQRRWTRLP